MCAELVKEPFNLRLDEIKRLDRWTLFNVYFRARNKHGQLIFQKASTERVLSDREAFMEHFRQAGVLERHLPKVWAEYEARRKAPKEKKR